MSAKIYLFSERKELSSCKYYKFYIL